MTLHREENTNDIDRLRELLSYSASFAEKNKQKILFVVHPRTKKIFNNNMINLDEFILSGPLGYFEMQYLVSNASYVFTDSGGLQKEAYFHRVPCVTLRDQTEWVETINSGWNRLWFNSRYNKRVEIEDYCLSKNVSHDIINKLVQVL